VDCLSGLDSAFVVGSSRPHRDYPSYLQVTETHFRTAQETTRSAADSGGTAQIEEETMLEIPEEFNISRDSEGYQVGGTRLELVTSTV
jgi:hypothetical protein